MGKTAKPKSKSASLHSRAARRAASPSLNVDKSITSLSRPEGSTTTSLRPASVLGAQHNSGISKKKSKGKPKSRAQRLRQEKVLERAEIVMDKMEKKITRSVLQGKKVKARKATWGDLNGEKREILIKSQNVDPIDIEERGGPPIVSQAVAPQQQHISSTAPTVGQQQEFEEDEIT